MRTLGFIISIVSILIIMTTVVLFGNNNLSNISQAPPDEEIIIEQKNCANHELSYTLTNPQQKISNNKLICTLQVNNKDDVEREFGIEFTNKDESLVIYNKVSPEDFSIFSAEFDLGNDNEGFCTHTPISIPTKEICS